MKIRTRICDVCGETIYQHARQTYVLRKRYWELEELGKRVDLCEECYERFIAWLKAERKEE